METVKVSKEVALEIGYAKEEFRSIAAATQYLLNEADLTDEQVDQALRGYYGGYEIERTPEENVRNYYESIKEQADKYAEQYDLGTVDGIKFTLNTLGIKIEGVNAE